MRRCRIPRKAFRPSVWAKIADALLSLGPDEYIVCRNKEHIERIRRRAWKKLGVSFRYHRLGRDAYIVARMQYLGLQEGQEGLERVSEQAEIVGPTGRAQGSVSLVQGKESKDEGVFETPHRTEPSAGEH